ncbi:MAG: peptidoglycan DD-metalloendopeptidase family protein, partial [bacterium]
MIAERSDRRRLAAAALLAALACAASAAAEPDSCSQDVVCLEARETSGAVELWVRHLATYEITLTLRASLSNMTPDVPLPITRTIQRGMHARLVTLRVRERGQGWSWHYDYHWVRGIREARHDDTYVYTLPYAAGTRREVMQGWNGWFSHRGDDRYAVDFDLAEGTMVYAARGGVVVGVMEERSEGGTEERLKDLGNFVLVRHVDGTEAEYYHFQQDGVLAEVGQEVKP